MMQDWLTKLTGGPSDSECRKTLGEVGYWVCAFIGVSITAAIVAIVILHL